MILPGLKLQLLGRPSRSQSLYRLRFLDPSCCRHSFILLIIIGVSSSDCTSGDGNGRGVEGSICSLNFKQLNVTIYLPRNTEEIHEILLS
jgi:hypothetical protein